jgi:hypothetical protein
MLLPDHLGERVRSQAIGERRIRRRRVALAIRNGLVCEEVGHGLET